MRHSVLVLSIFFIIGLVILYFTPFDKVKKRDTV